MTATILSQRAYSIKAAAAAVDYSADYIRRAIHTTNVDPSQGVHHLPAKQDSNGQYRIAVAALDVWIDQMQDAS